jgi:glutamate/tyrosine decarboxylase-like PLP-dependent enzyme
MEDLTTRLLNNAARYARHYLQGLEQRPVAPSAEAVAALDQFQRPLLEASTPAEAVLAELDRLGSPATMASAGGRFFGFVVGGSLPVAVAASWLATAWDQNAGLVVLGPINATLERVTLGWIIDILGLPQTCGGGFVTSATAGNFCALAAARHALLKRQQWDVEAQGLFGAPPITVVAGEELHASMKKALAMIGFGRERLIRVPCDAQGQLRIDALPQLDENTIVCVQAGNVNTGGFDPIQAICKRARAHKAWVHVDGAFGLWAAAAPARAHLVAGVENADSWSLDAHKWLNVPYDSGLVITRDAESLRAALSVDASYLSQSEERTPYQFTPDFSRRARGIEVWAALRHLGRSGLADLVERSCRHAQRFAAALKASGHHVLNEVVLNQVLVTFGSAERTLAVIGRIQADGTCWCGSTVWKGHTAMRISVSSWATTEQDVERSIAAILKAARD